MENIDGPDSEKEQAVVALRTMSAFDLVLALGELTKDHLRIVLVERGLQIEQAHQCGQLSADALTAYRVLSRLNESVLMTKFDWEEIIRPKRDP